MWFPLRVTKACVLIPARLDPGFAPASELKQVKHTEIVLFRQSVLTLCFLYAIQCFAVYSAILDSSSCHDTEQAHIVFTKVAEQC